MILYYDELKEGINEDFNRFYNYSFNEVQIFYAVLNEYQYGKGFCFLEEWCICLDLLNCYLKKNLCYKVILDNLDKLKKDYNIENIKIELGKDYCLYKNDILFIKKAINDDIWWMEI